MAALHYLTVQDMLWIHHQITKKVAPFHYAHLEEGTYYQYGYGSSTSLFPQAGRFLTGFPKMAPFAGANGASAFVGTVAFLALNGAHLQVSDAEASAWLGSLGTDAKAVGAALEAKCKVEEGHHDHLPVVRDAIVSALERYPKTIEALMASDAVWA